MPNVFPSGIFARNVTSYTSKLTVLCGSDEDEQKLNQGNPWLWQDLQTAGLGRNWLLAGTLSAAGINSGENRMFFFWKQESYSGTSKLSTCEGPVTLISLSTPAFSNMLSIASISWITSSLPEGFLTDQRERDIIILHSILQCFPRNWNTISWVFVPNNFMQGSAYMDGNSRSFFSRSLSSVVYLLKQTQILELDHKAILPVLATGSHSLLVLR